ncbi:MAG: 4Fe-4S binding protein [Gemmatimonadetes bacterium]|nr:4Fe-4S binding protein [Gemmatimonadota bacterium]
MPDLPRYRDLIPGATVVSQDAVQPHTGGWRLGRKPQLEASRCVNCLLCWLYCPDCAVAVRGTVVLGFDYDFCKGCELCVAVCPTGAISMVDEGKQLPACGRVG